MSKPFIPPKLPPDVDYTNIIGLISTARDAVARLDESIKNLPNPDIIQRTFQTKEAVLSSKIEGTQLTLKEALEFDAKDEQVEETEKQKDYREVVNYRHALEVGVDLLESKPLGENAIKTLHEILLSSVRGHNRDPGNFRKQQVLIGPPGATTETARYIPPPANKIKDLFKNLEEYLNSDNAPDPLVQVAIAHYQFEAIHPFVDGNGRVGRIIIPLFLYDKKITVKPNIFISEYLEENRSDYYDALKAVSDSEDWEGWINFFLQAVQEQSLTTSNRVKRVEGLYQDLINRIPEFNSIYAHSFIEALFRMPAFKPLQFKKATSISNNQTLYSLVDKFNQAGVIKELTSNRERDRIFIFTDLYDALR